MLFSRAASDSNFCILYLCITNVLVNAICCYFVIDFLVRLFMDVFKKFISQRILARNRENVCLEDF